MIALISVVGQPASKLSYLGKRSEPCEHKRALRAQASEGPRKGSLLRSRETRFTSLLAGYIVVKTGSVGLGGGYSGRYQGYAAGRLLPNANLILLCTFFDGKALFSYTFFWQMMGPFHITGLEHYISRSPGLWAPDIRKHLKKTHTQKQKQKYHQLLTLG